MMHKTKETACHKVGWEKSWNKRTRKWWLKNNVACCFVITCFSIYVISTELWLRVNLHGDDTHGRRVSFDALDTHRAARCLLISEAARRREKKLEIRKLKMLEICGREFFALENLYYTFPMSKLIWKNRARYLRIIINQVRWLSSPVSLKRKSSSGIIKKTNVTTVVRPSTPIKYLTWLIIPRHSHFARRSSCEEASLDNKKQLFPAHWTDVRKGCVPQSFNDSPSSTLPTPDPTFSRERIGAHCRDMSALVLKHQFRESPSYNLLRR